MLGERVGTYTLMGKRGLAALFFMEGLDLDLKRVRGRPLKLAIAGWLISLGLGLAAAVLLHTLPIVHAPLMIALALTTTAMGNFMPSLLDGGMLKPNFGTHTHRCRADRLGPPSPQRRVRGPLRRSLP